MRPLALVTACVLLGVAAATGLARAQAPPPVAAPTIDSVTPGERSLIVDWTAPAGVDAADILAYDVRSIESDAANKAASFWTVLEDAWIPGAGDLSWIIFPLTNDTQYDVQVRAFTEDGEGDWSDTVTGTPVANSGDRTGATPLPLNSTAIAVLTEDDQDFFKIEVTGDDTVDLWIYTISDLDTVGELQDSAGNMIARNDDGQRPDSPQDFVIREQVGAGTYYVTVHGYRPTVVGAYAVVLRTAPSVGGTIDRATTITLGDDVPGRIDWSTNNDFFRIDLTSAADLWIASSGYTDVVGELWDADRVLIARNDDSYLYRSGLNFAIWHEVKAGTYYIKVNGYASYVANTGAYTLHTGTILPPGDSIGSAQPISGVLIPGRVRTATDAHYYSLFVGSDTQVYIEADVGPNPMFSPEQPVSLAAQILDVHGNELDIYQIPHSAYIEDGRSFISFSINGKLPVGTHYLKIWSPSGGTGPYMLLVFGSTGYNRFINGCTDASASLDVPGVNDALYGCQWHLHNGGQYEGGAGEDINVEAVWTTNMGAGVNVAVVDDGIHFEHEDLTENAAPSRNRNYSTRADIFDPFEHHGTSTAGLIAARDNSIGMRGVAPRATIYGYNLFADFTDANTVDAAFRMAQGGEAGDETTDVSSNSWGPTPTAGPRSTSASWEMAVQNGVTSGANGKGIFYAFAAGNGHYVTHHANLNGRANYYAVTAVCAVNYDDVRSGYSEMGANLWVCAPSNDDNLPEIATTYGGHLYTDEFGGTSAATPIVSGVAALLRTANSSLTWRDLKLILAASARKNDADNTGWAQGALEYGSDSEHYFFNHEYGFGVVDAGAAVALAADWTNVPALREISAESAGTDLHIPDAPSDTIPGTTVSSSLTIGNHVGFVEFVEIHTTFDHESFRELEVELESPSGARSTLTWVFDRIYHRPVEETIRFGSARHLGENAAGTWTLHITDHLDTRTGTLEGWSLTVYGHGLSPGRPGISALTPAVGELAVEWSAPADIGGSAVTGYDLRYIESDAADRAATNWTLVEGAWTSGALEYTLGSLDPTVRYDVQVRAANDAGPGPWSDAVAGTTLALALPSVASVTPDDRSLTVAWTAPAQSGGEPIAAYDLRYIETSEDEAVDADWTVVDSAWTGGALAYTISALDNGTRYDVQVRAVTTSNGDWSASLTGTPRTVPAAPAIDDVTWGDQELTVVWTAPSSDGGAAITTYDVRYIETSEDEAVGANWTVLDGVWAAGALHHVLTGLENGTQYDLQVRAVNAAGEGPWSATTARRPRTVPGAPTIDSVTGGQRSLSVEWSAPASDGGADVSSYHLRYRPTNTEGKPSIVQWTLLADIWTSGALEYTISGLEHATQYDVRMRAVNLVDEGEISELAQGSTLSLAPTVASVTPDDGSLTVAWTAPTSVASTEITAYDVRWIRSDAPGKPADHWDLQLLAWETSGALQYTISGLANGVAYDVGVRPVTSAGEGDWSLSWSGTPRTLPAAPAIDSVTPDAGSLTIVWAAPASDGGAAITSYAVRSIRSDAASKADGNWTVQDDAWTSGALQYTLSGLDSGVAYDVQVRAVNAAGDGPWSATQAGETATDDDASLSALTLSEGRLSPAFAGGTTSYTASVGYTVTPLTVTATANDASAAVAFLDGSDDPLPDADGNAAGHQVDLSVGDNAINLQVTARDGTTTLTYSLTVTRAEEDTSLTPPASDPVVAVASSAVYTITFTGTWTTAVTPDGRPGSAHFSPLIGAVHSAEVSFLKSGELASAGVESMAETGGTSDLRSEVDTAINASPPTALSVLRRSGNIGATGTGTLNNVKLTSEHPRVTLTTMIAPSPDWFVGISGRLLLDAAGEWLPSHTLNLYPWDAGTEDGTGFSLSNSATSPQGVITSIRGTGKFTIAPIATLTFTRQSVSPSFPAAESGARGIPENTAAGENIGAPVAATDPDGHTLTYALGGTDADSFGIVATSGQLRTKAALDHEAKSSYSVTVTATDTTGLKAAVDVTITVSNVNEPGSVSLWPLQPEAGTALTATLDDSDGGVQSLTWAWHKSSDRSTWTSLSGSGDSYTPVDGDVGAYIRARASYTDAGGSGRTAEAVSDQTVVRAPEITVVELVTGLSIPWDLAFTPDGTMLFTQRSGVLSSRLGDGTVQTVSADFGDLYAFGETGLMGIVVDPAFASNRRFYTCQGHTGPEIQVIAWTIDADYTTATRVADPLVGDLPAAFGGRHGGCRLRFGPQGYLWIATGDAATGTVPQDLGSLGGKVLRVNAATGAAAPGNPFNSRVYSYGHRNVQGLALRPGTSQMWSVEHGPFVDDEINLLVSGGNYGWNPVPGYNESVPMTDLEEFPGAVEAVWSSGAPTLATSGGIFLEGDDWGAWEGRLAVATLAAAELHVFKFSADGALMSQVVVAELDGTYARLRTPMLGPNGALYVTTSNTSSDRILLVAPSLPPAFPAATDTQEVAENSPTSTVVATVTATDPEGQALTYTLGGTDAALFNIADPAGGQVRANTPLDYEAQSSYQVVVTASDPYGLSDSITLTINVSNVVELTTLTGPASVSYAENGALRVATYTASSPEHSESIAWSLSGVDAAHFSVDNPAGVLRFHIDPTAPNLFPQPPDFEDPADAGSDNAYQVTLTASEGADSVTRQVSVSVSDENEAGVVTISPVRPRVGTALTATLTDPDGSTSGVAWTWQRSTGPTTWAAIDGANSNSYTPTAADAGHYLRVTATYSDDHGAGQTAGAVAPYTPLAHQLSALSVAGPARGPYPAFDPDVLHYAMECAAGQTITLTLSAAQSSTRLAVNGVQRPSRNAVVELTGLDGHSDIPITLSGGQGGATTYVLHCFEEDFPDISTEQGPGATEELIGFSLNTNPPSGRYAYMMIVDNNGVPRVHRRFGHRVTHFRPQNSETYPFSYSVPDADTKHVWVLVDRALNELGRVITVAPLLETDKHDFIILDNGDYLLLSYEPVLRDFSYLVDSDGNPAPPNPDRSDGLYPVTDTAIQIRTAAGAAKLTWYSWDHMAAQDCGGNPFVAGDWAHGNSLWLADGVIVASFRQCGKVLAIDAATGDVVWRLGRSYRSPEEWGSDELSGHGRGAGPAPMTILNDRYGGFCGQHSAQVLDNGHLLLYDNGFPCIRDPATGLNWRTSGEFSRAVEYAIDSGNGEAIFQRHHSLHGDFNRGAWAAGLVEPMDNGDWLVSWGFNDGERITALPPDESMTQVDPDTGTEKFSINIQIDHSGEENINVRAYPLSPTVLADEPLALEAALPASSHSLLFNPGAPQVVVAFSRPVVDFDADTTSVSITGATVASAGAHVMAGQPANAYRFTLTPDAMGTITFRLVADQPCAGGGICTADGTVLSAGVTVTIDRPEHPENSTRTSVAVSTAGVTLAGPDSAAFEIRGGALQFRTAPDFESPADDGGDNSYQVMIVDSGNPTSLRAVTIAVSDVNEAPAFPAGESGARSIPENTAAGLNIGAPVAATDDDNDALTYTLGGTDAASFSIGASTGQLRTDAAPDHETKSTYTVSVGVRDSRDASGNPDTATDATITVTIAITDVNEPPAISGEAAIDFAEHGTGIVATYTATDPEDRTLIWEPLAGPDRGHFTFSGGVLGFVAPPDFESPADSGENNEYLVRVRISDGVNDDTLDVTVTVTNEEEAGTLTLSSQQPLVGTLLTATLDDPDGDITSLSWTWERSQNRSNWSEIDGATTESYTPAGDDLDHYLRVTASYDDGEGADKSAQETSDERTQAAPVMNEPPAFAAQITPRSIEENSAEGTPVGDPVTATDPDADTLWYTLSGIGIAADLFSIEGGSGQIRVGQGAVLDYEALGDGTGTSFFYTVAVTAADPSNASASILVTITVTDVNEPPEATGDDATTDEDTATTIDVLFNDSDPEGDTLTVSVSTPPASGAVTVEADNSITYAPDADFHGVDTFTYQASDGVHSSAEAMVVVTVNPVNDPPDFPAATAERSVAANAAGGREVGLPVEATDRDGDTLTYVLAGAAGLFDIDPDTGQITVGVGTVLDASVQDSYLVTVTATDPSSEEASIEVTITVSSAGPTGPGPGGGGGGGGGGPSGPSPSELDFEWNVKRDLEALDGGHDTPTGAWSDGTVLWVLENGDGAGDAVYAYDLNTGERLEEREFELDERNRAPRGVWSGGTVIWVSDSGQDRLFGHDLETGERLPERDLELDEDNGAARGIWSDGERMWVLDGGKDSLFAYDLGSGALVAEYALDDANGDPHGIWSDGVTIWVSDHGAKRLFAYRLEDGELVRNSEEEFTELSKASNNSPRGIWSDGEVIYVADESDDKVYSYNMPDAIDARLASLTLSGIEIGEFSGDRTEYDGVAAEGVTETTVEAEALQRRTTVLIEPADAGGDDTNGHQLALEGIDAITVIVTSADGSRTRVYRVRLEGGAAQEAPWPECLRGDIAAGFSTVVYAGGSVEELEACVRSLHVTALYVLDEGEFVSYILGAPAFVNQPFVELFADGLPPVTPLVAASKGPPPGADTDGAGARLAALTLSGVAIGEFSGERTQYAGAAGEGVTQTTVGAAAVQHTARVLIEPADGDGDAANGHQVGLEEGAEIVVTVTSQDGSRTRVYRVWVGSAEEEREPAPECLRGGIAAGFSLVVYEGGGVGQLEACARSLHVSALYVLDEGVFVSYILGAPEFVNRPFHELFPHGVPPLTPLVAASDGP